MENKKNRFRRVAEARVNKIIKMVRLLGNCSEKAIYQYEPEQVEEIFDAIRAELDQAQKRFYIGKHRFSLSESYNLQWEMLVNPHVSLTLPDGNKLTAVVFQQDDYPSINIYLQQQQQEGSELICFAEHNPDRGPCHTVHIGAYQSDEDEPKYYAPYRAERNDCDE